MKYGYVNGTNYRPRQVQPWKNTQKKAHGFSNFEYINPYPQEEGQQQQSGKQDGIKFEESTTEGVQSKNFCPVITKGKAEFSSFPYIAHDYDSSTQAMKVF